MKVGNIDKETNYDKNSNTISKCNYGNMNI